MGKDFSNEPVIIDVDHLTKDYGYHRGVFDVSIKVHKGECYGYLGPNGAGKSTTIRSIMNLINKTSGNVFVNGKEFNKNDIETNKIIGYLPSEINLYDDLTVLEMLNYHEKFFKKDA